MTEAEAIAWAAVTLVSGGAATSLVMWARSLECHEACKTEKKAEAAERRVQQHIDKRKRAEGKRPPIYMQK